MSKTIGHFRGLKKRAAVPATVAGEDLDSGGEGDRDDFLRFDLICFIWQPALESDVRAVETTPSITAAPPAQMATAAPPTFTPTIVPVLIIFQIMFAHSSA